VDSRANRENTSPDSKEKYKMNNRENTSVQQWHTTGAILGQFPIILNQLSDGTRRASKQQHKAALLTRRGKIRSDSYDQSIMGIT